MAHEVLANGSQLMAGVSLRSNKMMSADTLFMYIMLHMMRKSGILIRNLDFSNPNMITVTARVG